MFAPKKILVPTDFSKFSDNALKQAYDIAKQYKAKIYLLHVIEIVQTCSIDYCLDDQSVKALDEKSLEFSEKMIQKQINKVFRSKDVEVVSDVKKGRPYEEILKEQTSKKIDLIVIASHGRTGILSHLIGSIAEKVVRGAKCPVMVVRNK
jgi:universal stress protein A